MDKRVLSSLDQMIIKAMQESVEDLGIDDIAGVSEDLYSANGVEPRIKDFTLEEYSQFLEKYDGRIAIIFSQGKPRIVVLREYLILTENL